jgi:hypothetical protein
MPSPTPVRDGFRTLWGQPSIFLAEISWRWSWGGAALLLFALALFEYLHTLTVTPTDLMLLRLRHPLAVSRALLDIFQGSGPRVVRTAILLIPALALLWTLLGALGRFATLRALIAPGATDLKPTPRSLRALLGLNFLRVALALAALVSLLASGLVASFVSTPRAPHVGMAFLLFLPLAILMVTLWSTVNWFLSMAAVFVVRDGEDTFGSIAAAVECFRRCAGKISSTGFWFGAMRLVVFVIGTTVVMYPLSMASFLPPSVTLVLMGLVALAYCAVADFFYLARLAGYVSIVEWDHSPGRDAETAIPLAQNPPPPAPTHLPDVNISSGDDDEPLFSSRPPRLSSEEFDDEFEDPLMPGFSPGEPLRGR